MQNKLKSIEDLSLLEGMKVLLRVDFNVPIDEQGEITNDYRIKQVLPTIKSLQEKNLKVIVIAHRESGSLRPVANYLKKNIEGFNCINEVKGERVVEAVDNLQNGEMLLLENLRLNEGEKKNDPEFAKFFVELVGGDGAYINEAFSASHRKHASIVGIPSLLPDRSAFGPNFISEVEKLTLALNPTHPTFLVIGGAKFETKLELLEKFINIADKIFVGGALAHSFWKQKDYNLGKSLIDTDVSLEQIILNSDKIILPIDVLIEDNTGKSPTEISENEKIVDFGENTLQEILKVADESKTIIWNGPLGFYEKGYSVGTIKLIKALGVMQDKAIILGGGDTVAVLEKVMNENPELKFTHVSSAGGAMIDFLSNGTLPGIETIK